MLIVTTTYCFKDLTIAERDALQQQFQALGKNLNLGGLVLITLEGLNLTIAGKESDITTMKQALETEFGNLVWKDTPADEQPFKRWLVKTRDESIKCWDCMCKPMMEGHNHISPTEWKRMMDEEDVVLIDTRNTYENKIGMFDGAIDLELDDFQELPEKLMKQEIPKDKKVLIYCTGGIRCEKVMPKMLEMGYKHVYQLSGGIIQYMMEYPNTHFKGECFVFDHRTAINQDLKPSTNFACCPFCGDPGDISVSCKQCNNNESKLCTDCLVKHGDLCSKDCRYHYNRVQSQVK